MLMFVINGPRLHRCGAFTGLRLLHLLLSDESIRLAKSSCPNDRWQNLSNHRLGELLPRRYGDCARFAIRREYRLYRAHRTSARPRMTCSLLLTFDRAGIWQHVRYINAPATDLLFQSNDDFQIFLPSDECRSKNLGPEGSLIKKPVIC